MSYRTILRGAIAERASARLTAVLKDEFGARISSADLDALTLTLYDRHVDKVTKLITSTVLNAKEDIDVMNANGGSLDDTGNFVLLLEPNDNSIVTPTKEAEVHVALLEFVWDGGAKEGRHEVVFTVANLHKVP